MAKNINFMCQLPIRMMANTFLFLFNQSLQQWQSVFWVTAAVYAATWLIFANFASTEIQPWNFAEDDEKTDMESQKFLENEKKVEIVKNGSADTKEVS